MAYDATIKKYLRDAQKEYIDAQRGGQHTAELSFRTQLHALFKGLAHDLNPSSNISVILEPKNQGKVGRPDWRIHDSNTLGIFGYIEAKVHRLPRLMLLHTKSKFKSTCHLDTTS